MISKKDLISDLKFCQALMDKLVSYAQKNYKSDKFWASNHTVIQNDIKRLRRELNDINHKLEWDYRNE